MLQSSSVDKCDTTEMLCLEKTLSSIRAHVLRLQSRLVNMVMPSAGVLVSDDLKEKRFVEMRDGPEPARFRFRFRIF